MFIIMKKFIKTFLTIFAILPIIVANGQNCSPNFKEIYDFPIGSVFQYKTTVSSEASFEEIIIENYKVTDKWWNADTLYYARQGIKDFTLYNLGNLDRTIENSYNENINDTITVIDSSTHFLNACDSQLVNIASYRDYYSYIIVDDPEKIIGGFDNLYEYNENDSLIHFNDEEIPDYGFNQVYKARVGLHSSSEGFIMSSTRIECEGYVIDGDTIGTIDDFNYNTSIHNLLADVLLNVYPTIISDNEKINIVTSQDYSTIKVLSLDGKIHPIRQTSQDYIILDGLPKGVYLITLLFDDKKVTRKIIKH